MEKLSAEKEIEPAKDDHQDEEKNDESLLGESRKSKHHVSWNDLANQSQSMHLLDTEDYH